MERLKQFLRVGHLPTLLSSFLYFDISFMIWVILGATGTFIVEDLGLTPAQKGMMVGIPVLGGALLRIPMGLLADRFGGKKMGMIGMILTSIPLFWGWLFADTLTHIYALGLLLGIAGASFAVALPLASRWYPKEHQGLAMGIAGAGNSGTVLAMLFGPRLAEAHGWNSVFGLALIPLIVAFIVFILFAKECPTAVKPTKMSEYTRVMKMKETWLFSFFYSLSFGGFVGMTSYLTLFFFDQYGVDKVTAGDFVTLVVFAGSFVRPIGGYLADKYGGMKLLVWLFTGATVTLTIVGMLPPVYVALALLFVTLIFFGTANGALFQVIPNVFPKEVGLLTGFVGAAGGLGGFFLPNILGMFKQWTNSYSYGFWWIAATMLVAMLIMRRLRKTIA
ncbi:MULTISPECIES: nitrate/nitrite transporter [Anoxybacillus]|uniref:NNP family nitrate/nitrite transporter-like MFS transporter n=2 Tax=Anoxybacillus TaxID=150247 RepID=A0A7X0D8C2_9BACL|nr:MULTISPECIES: nitrate/nitrite transporter [Anoxybacillus]EMT47260.1 major facilitator superfamily protein [Anoxybacillus flavithermus AK1]MBB6175413.1 NNP family nitrate/nitrite transporter-like MFS transporter [Anoxybacillus tengchongensis]